ncbi:MAG: SHOCT domain-containing protein [Pseudodesulfovibrio sp.]
MTLPDIPALAAGFLDFMDNPIWRAWPFNAGYGEHLLPAVARMIFVALIMGGVLLFLRFLFGPGGRLRDEEMDREAEAERRRERAELDEQLAGGKISEMEYKVRMKGLED